MISTHLVFPSGEPFQKCRLDFVRPFTPKTKSIENMHILVAIDYYTKWVGPIPRKDNEDSSVTEFLYKNIMMKFGCHVELVSDQGSHFVNNFIAKPKGHI